ncbi:hypothetical protein GCM10009809_25170 [Isoptericola hypogeus]|uniref:Rho termination factor-like N-terminal domain-containing protein n=1 Tax=Isoptericola hypogeus TaxID=300179 RepID=A0ABP4VMV8_9MICO
MTRSNPVVWLGRQARRGLTDLPRNIVWALDTGVKNPARSAGDSVQAAGQRAAATLADANPFSGGSDGRLDRVDSAMERAHELETVAHDKARHAKERADAASAAEAEGERRLAETRDEADDEVARVVAEAQREADDYVAAKRNRAQEVTGRQVEAAEADVRRHVEQARGEAEKARAEAEQAIERARQQMKRARELAEEAAAAARQAADEARARAERLAEAAEEDAREARRRVEAADGRRDAVASEGRQLGADADIDPLDLDDRTKSELLALGSEMGLDLTTSMRKQQIVSAIRKHADDDRS